MATREEIDKYCEEQWRKLRAPGDWRGVAERFWRWGEGKFWRLQKPWQGIIDDWLVEERAKKQANARRALEAAQSGGRTKRYTVLVCMLCWRPFEPPANDGERDWIGELACCRCAEMARCVSDGGNILARVAQRGGRTYTIAFEEKPAAMRVMDEIRRLKERVMMRYGSEVAELQREWHDGLGGAYAEQNIA